MIKVHASYAKKVPAEVEFSSKSYSASLEIEVADDITHNPEKLREILGRIWSELKTSVNAQIAGDERSYEQPPENGSSQSPPFPYEQPPYQNSMPAVGNGSPPARKASNKQIQYLLALGRDHGYDFKSLNNFAMSQVGKDSLYKLDTREASQLIDHFKNK